MKMKRTILFLLTLLAGLSAGAVAFAGGGGVPTGALETTQLVNKAQLIKQVEEAMQQTTHLLNQYENMVLNTQKLSSTLWDDAAGELTKLRNLLSTIEGLTFGASFDDEKYEAKYPGYRDSTETDYAEYYKEQVAYWHAYYRAALAANNMAIQNILDDQAFINELNKASKNGAQGQMQMLQAANQISIFMAQQLSKLRMDMQRQIESQATHALTVQQQAADEESSMEAAIGTWKDMDSGKLR